jgi:hypothetical protein
MPEVLAFSAKALFDCANILVLVVMTLFGRPQMKSRAVMSASLPDAVVVING